MVFEKTDEWKKVKKTSQQVPALFVQLLVLGIIAGTLYYQSHEFVGLSIILLAAMAHNIATIADKKMKIWQSPFEEALSITRSFILSLPPTLFLIGIGLFVFG